jgi:hypothetical protein
MSDKTINDGGQAFPTVYGPEHFEEGLSLRAYIAAKALPAVLEHPEAIALGAERMKITPSEALAKICCEYADALIKELEK